MQVWGFTRHGHWVLIDITVLRRLSLPDTYEYPGAIQAQNVTPLVILEKTGADPRRMLEQLDDMARIARYQVARNLKLLQELTDRKFGIWAAVAARESKQG